MKILSHNRKVRFDYNISHTRDAGVVLLGHEVKSIKSSTVQLGGSTIYIRDAQIYRSGSDISPYSKAHPKHIGSYTSTRSRKLLLKKKEIQKIYTLTHKTGLSILPIELYLSTHGLIKLKIGVGSIRRKIDKKEYIKDRDFHRSKNLE